MAESIQLRFRHQHGDIGPIGFTEDTSFLQVKEKLLADWPTEGPISTESPAQVADIKLILSGKFIDATKTVKDYKNDMGEIKADTIVTMHVVVRPSSSPEKASATGSPKDGEESAKGCGCTIS